MIVQNGAGRWCEGVGLGFTFVVWGVLGGQRAWEYVTAYLVEKVSIDNLFVFLVIFRTLSIPQENQRSVLSWGIFGALVFRLAFVLVGVAAIERDDWVLYVFAALLAWAAVRMVREDVTKEKESNRRTLVAATPPGHTGGSRHGVSRALGWALAPDAVARRVDRRGADGHRLRDRLRPCRARDQSATC